MPRGGLLLKLGIAAASAAAIVLLVLYVSLTRAFEGHSWRVPSSVYSDVLVLRPGERLSAGDLVHRLDRSGYARVAGAARDPGQYSAAGARVALHLRAFETPGRSEPARRIEVRFDGERVDEVRDAAGRRLAAVAVEPERLATLYGARQEERLPVRLEDVPPRVVHAVLAAEDSRFFAHRGLDLRGIARAAAANVSQGRIVQGGSTITQQTVKNLFLGGERTWARKLREAVLSLMLDARYSKQRILEVYLNEVYLGQRGAVAICGLGAAARFYFGHDLPDLSLGESALLAGLIRNPGGYNPFARSERALERRGQVLDALARLELEPDDEIEAARSEPLRLASGAGGFPSAPYAVDFVRSQLAELYSAEILSREGLRIHTTIDTRWQEVAERALREGLERLEREVPPIRDQLAERSLQGAVIVTRPSSGAIVAMVGGRDYAQSQFNRAVQARRQPGSCFKPFVFAAGLAPGPGGEQAPLLTLATLLDDAPLEIVSGGRTWSPENYDHLFRGPVTARRALEESLNVPTVVAARHVGIERVIDTAEAAGIVSPLPALPSLALGTVEVTPLELSTAYGTFARLGERLTPWVVSEVTDSQSRVLARRKVVRERAIDERAAFLIHDALEGVVARGTAKSAADLGFRGTAAGKTGTTDDTRDAWFVGYTSDVLGLVWIGYDDNARTGLSGATGALPIWVEVLGGGPVSGEDGRPAPPPGLVVRRLDPATGGLVVRGCPEWRDEWFLRGSEPTRTCPAHRGSWIRRWLGRSS
jgi:penicillin-binding protein 1B